MKRFHLMVAAVLLFLHTVAGAADVAYFTEPLRAGLQKVSAAVSAREYRLDAARNIYAAYASRVFKGRLPPLIHAVVVVETVVGESGQAREVRLVRGPSHAPDVSFAVMEMIRRVPLPAPSRLGSGIKFTEIWLVHKDGRFQLDALTEGQD